jgi:hypothetical protein
VRGAGWYDHDISRRISALCPADPEDHLGSVDLEALLLLRVNMRRGDESAGSHEDGHFEQAAMRVRGTLPKYDSLACNRVNQRIVQGSEAAHLNDIRHRDLLRHHLGAAPQSNKDKATDVEGIAPLGANRNNSCGPNTPRAGGLEARKREG